MNRILAGTAALANFFARAFSAIFVDAEFRQGTPYIGVKLGDRPGRQGDLFGREPSSAHARNTCFKKTNSSSNVRFPQGMRDMVKPRGETYSVTCHE